MKAVIDIGDVPEFQIGRIVRVYFPDSMIKSGWSKPASGWISVKDRLPKEPPWDAKWVLVWFGDGSEIHTEAPCVGKYNIINDSWYVLGKTLGNKSDIMRVTHWMPLPEPPKEVSVDD